MSGEAVQIKQTVESQTVCVFFHKDFLETATFHETTLRGKRFFTLSHRRTRLAIGVAVIDRGDRVSPAHPQSMDSFPP